MKIVTLTSDMRPYRKGDRPLLPDELAKKLIEEGAAVDLRPDPRIAEAQDREKQTRKRYLTRKR